MAIAQAFDRLDAPARDLAHGDEAGAGLPSVEQHGAGAAVARIATHLGAGESEVVAQRRRQPRDRRTLPLGRTAVQGEHDLHDAKPSSRRRSSVTTASLPIGRTAAHVVDRRQRRQMRDVDAIGQARVERRTGQRRFESG